MEITTSVCLEKIKKHDINTHDHCLRVASLSSFIGENIGLSENELINLNISACLHDVGKTEIPRSTLNNTENLSEAEWDMIKNHPIYSVEMLNPVKNKYPQSVMFVVR